MFMHTGWMRILVTRFGWAFGPEVEDAMGGSSTLAFTRSVVCWRRSRRSPVWLSTLFRNLAPAPIERRTARMGRPHQGRYLEETNMTCVMTNTNNLRKVAVNTLELVNMLTGKKIATCEICSASKFGLLQLSNGLES